MPLYTFECPKCNKKIEKFLHSADIKIECGECGEECNRIFGEIHSRKRMDAKELFAEKIQPDAEKIMDNIGCGKDEDFLDIYGDS
jgi:putative FmdB family regulatory protein